MQGGERFERYTPKFPLPVDISNMSRQDTICKFCGVSYLIHNEIKLLEAKCQKLEADLAFYAGISSREAALEQSLQTERGRIADLESIISINTHKFNEITRKLQLYEEQLQQSDKAHRETKSKLYQSTTKVRAIQSQIKSIQTEHSAIKDLHAKENQISKAFFHTVESTIQKEIRKAIDKFSKQINSYQLEISQYQQQLNESQQNVHDFQMKFQQYQSESTQSNKKAQKDLESAREEVRIYQNEISTLREQLKQVEENRTQLKNEYEHKKQHCRQLEQQINEKDQSKNSLELLIEQYCQQITSEKELRLKSDEELEIIRTKFNQLTIEYEHMSLSKKDLETNELNNRRKNDEANRSRQAVLDRTRDEYEKLLRKYHELDETYQELVNLRQKEASESDIIRRELERLHNENIELTKQKETLIITHDVQIKKLHDTYSVRLRDVEQWPDRLQAELNHERERHRLELVELERRLKENYLTELNIEKQKTDSLLRKYEQDNDHSRQQLRHELISTEKVTIEQRQYYQDEIEQLQQDKSNLKQELNKLRDVLKELHEQISNQEASNNDRLHNLQLKEDLVKKETCLFQAQATINELKKELEQTHAEMNTLQETVHKECTEREQLKDSLIEARQQLLALKKNGILNGTASRALHSPPVAFEEIERRVSGPLPRSHSQNQQYTTTSNLKNPSFILSEPATRDSSLPGDAADLMARPMSSSQTAPYRHKPLPPIHPQQQQQQRRNGVTSSINKAEQLMENKQRIARLLKHVK